MVVQALTRQVLPDARAHVDDFASDVVLHGSLAQTGGGALMHGVKFYHASELGDWRDQALKIA